MLGHAVQRAQCRVSELMSSSLLGSLDEADLFCEKQNYLKQEAKSPRSE